MDSLKFLLNKKLRFSLGVAILVVTAGLLYLYSNEHPEIWIKIKSVEPNSLIMILFLYSIFFLSLLIVMWFSLSAFNKRLGARDTTLLGAYSSLTNFFGPGQSGPGFRAVYLKAKVGLKIKHYILITLVYYAFYAVISGVMLLAGFESLGLSLLGFIVICFCFIMLIRWYGQKNTLFKNTKILKRAFIGIFFGTLLQCATQAGIYFVEFASIGVNASFLQTISFTGAANFSLFVSLTPGAIGIRESFLLFSQSIHNISSDVIVSVGILDRAVYVLFLGLLFLLILLLHGRNKFQEFRSKE